MKDLLPNFRVSADRSLTFRGTLVSILISATLSAMADGEKSVAGYRLTVIESVSGGGATSLSHINNRGHAVGSSTDAAGFAVPIIYRDGQVERLGNLPGIAVSINDGDETIAYISDGDYGFSALFTGGKMVNLDQLAGERLLLTGINNRGEIAGRYGQPDSEGKNRVFIYSQGVFRTLGAWPGAEPIHLNNLGQIVGLYDGPGIAPEATLWHAVLFRDGQLQDLTGLPGAEMNIARMINDGGDIIGQSFFGVFERRPFLYRNGKVHDLGTLGQDNATTPYGMNNLGDFVGDSAVDNRNARGVLYHDKKMHDLNHLIIPKSRWHIFVGWGINDRGEIIAEAEDRANAAIVRAVLLTPADREWRERETN